MYARSRVGLRSTCSKEVDFNKSRSACANETEFQLLNENIFSYLRRFNFPLCILFLKQENLNHYASLIGSYIKFILLHSRDHN